MAEKKSLRDALTELQGELKTKAPELLAELHAASFAICAENGVGEDVAAQIAADLVDRIASAWGGQIVYIPQGMALRLAARDQQMWDDFDGRNVAALARRYGLGVQQVYRILRLQKSTDLASRQDALPLL